MEQWQIGLVGNSPAFQRALELLAKVAKKELPVLLTGETGTGKELFARAIHFHSGRSRRPFEAINCGAIPDTLLEAELFGVQRGAYSDAYATRRGLLQAAGEGSVFLDEIGDLPLALQVKLLRAIQEREVKPVGADRAVPIAARFIFATNKDLEAEVQAGRFRQDLLFRINAFPIQMPALRDRVGDIPSLVEYFRRAFNDRYGASVPAFGEAALRRLESYSYPGNVRELQNLVERTCILAEDGAEHPDELVLNNDVGLVDHPGDLVPSAASTYHDAKQRFEKSYLVSCLASAQGNISEASRISGLYRSDVYRMMRKYGLKQDQFKGYPAPP